MVVGGAALCMPPLTIDSPLRLHLHVCMHQICITAFYLLLD